MSQRAHPHPTRHIVRGVRQLGHEKDQVTLRSGCKLECILILETETGGVEEGDNRCSTHICVGHIRFGTRIEQDTHRLSIITGHSIMKSSVFVLWILTVNRSSKSKRQTRPLQFPCRGIVPRGARVLQPVNSSSPPFDWQIMPVYDLSFAERWARILYELKCASLN